MSNAGYGNHDAPPPNADPKASKETPSPTPGKPVQDGTNAAPRAAERRDSSTPSEGALSDGAQGDEVDPGVG